jgi:hypothetical protein
MPRLMAEAGQDAGSALLLQLDGKLPNHALLRLSAHLKRQGCEVSFRRISNPRSIEPGLWDRFDAVYASCIFEWSRPLCKRLLEIYPHAIIGGSGWDERITLESIGVSGFDKDYSFYPDFQNSLGYTQRGCRLKCSFCKVPRMEPELRAEEPFLQIWRGEPYPKNVVLLDNDFFGQPDWREHIRVMREGNFKVSFNQGVNSRLFDEESAAAIASVRYYDADFKTKRIYTAWDNINHEKRLFAGLQALVANGVKPDEIMVYMLIGDANDTPEGREYRRRKLREFGCRPYPMPFVRTPELVGFQRWVIRRGDLMCNWEDYRLANFRPERVASVNADLPLFHILQDGAA